MLVHVEVYSPEWIPGDPPQQQYHASLAASTSADRLLRIGRKTGDVLLSKDKSISREHVFLTVASTSSRERTVSASTAEEKAACEEDEDGLCVVLNNVGKLGTYLAAEEQRAHNSKNGGEDDDSSGTDETDDEEAVKVSQMEQNPVPVSVATRHLFHGKSVRLQEVLAPVALKYLSRSGGRAVFQCGKMGSTIVLTRKVIEVLVSGNGPHGFSDWNRTNFYKLGLRQSSQFVAGRTSIVVCQKRKLNVKQLSAWSLTVPIVTYEFLYAYLNARKSPSDPLFPLNPKDFAPAADEHTFWFHSADPMLLSSCTLLSTTENDMETLAEAAGAAVKKLYDEGSKTSNAAMVKRAQLILDSTPHCFGIFEKRPKKLDTELQSKAELRLVKSEEFLNAIMEQVLPKDTEGKVVGRMTSQHPVRNADVALDGEDHYAKDVQNDTEDVPPVEGEGEDNLVIMEQDDSIENHSLPGSKEADETNAVSAQSIPIITATDRNNPDEPSSHAPKRRKMGIASGKGWFRAAPKDRSAHVKCKEDTIVELDSSLQVAVTDICPDLILPSVEVASQTVNRTGGPDFRAFRKNRVSSVPSYSRIELRSVLPRESEQLMQEYEEQETALAKQRMRADDLFRDSNQK